MTNNPKTNWREEFNKEFGDNVVWWQECIAEMRIGDPDFRRLKSFIDSLLTRLANEMGEKDLAENLHVWYLEAVKSLKPESFNSEANKPYSELTEEQRFIDKYIAEKIRTAQKTLLKDNWGIEI